MGGIPLVSNPPEDTSALPYLETYTPQPRGGYESACFYHGVQPIKRLQGVVKGIRVLAGNPVQEPILLQAL